MTQNQRDLLNDFYQKHIEEFESVSEYVDDGHTGTDANRENFQRLLADVMSGKINCVVVKDLSRFARNYSDAGSLIDNLFVQMGVRFISLAENVDSYLNPDSVSSIIVPITNPYPEQTRNRRASPSGDSRSPPWQSESPLPAGACTHQWSGASQSEPPGPERGSQ